MLFFNRLLQEKDYRIAELQERVRVLESERNHERERAENAIEQLLLDSNKSPVVGDSPTIIFDENQENALLKEALLVMNAVGKEVEDKEVA